MSIFLHGWIKKHRKIQNSWIWENAEYYRAWDAILYNVNYESGKQLIKSKLIPYERGESLRSLESWGTLFGGWSKGKVKRFFNLLEKDEMIVTQSVTVTTRLTVVNYSEYQERGNGNETQDETQAKRKRNASGTQSKNIKNPKEDKEKKYSPRKAADGFDWIDDGLWNEWIEHKKSVKAKVTKRSIDANIRTLKGFGESVANKHIVRALEKGWKDFYPIDGQSCGQQQQYRADTPPQDYEEL